MNNLPKRMERMTEGKQKQTMIEKFKALSTVKKLVISAVLLVLLQFVLMVLGIPAYSLSTIATWLVFIAVFVLIFKKVKSTLFRLSKHL